jgi:RNA polymerase sigma-70 factor (ECF subfamily)
MWLRKKKGNPPKDDAEIIASYRDSGDPGLLGVLFERYAHLVFGVCMKYLKNEEDSKDAMMQVFESLGDDLRKYRIRSFPPWLHSVAKNHCLMQLRKRRLLVNDEHGYRQAEATLLTMPDGMHFMEEEVQETHLRNLERAMASLGTEQRQCIRLFYLEERSYQEVSDATGYDLKQVKSYIQNGKRNLRNFLLRHTPHFNE